MRKRDEKKYRLEIFLKIIQIEATAHQWIALLFISIPHEKYQSS
jgi:hypothetical protein